ncbi:hypothetical protein K457DRAFT_133976 [Linnemannia elongata AG-77]|uniref:Uncharacterized protein n=1 Tax=Linnemannia elongata AG-77 TaxID=1314771 RepID=A0A197K8W3_9FUNG|nr:hypothetical protein K457DRAFT_133976 [Linnemannia elongata AG-77]
MKDGSPQEKSAIAIRVISTIKQSQHIPSIPPFTLISSSRLTPQCKIAYTKRHSKAYLFNSEVSSTVD